MVVHNSCECPYYKHMSYPENMFTTIAAVGLHRSASACPSGIRVQVISGSNEMSQPHTCRRPTMRRSTPPLRVHMLLGAHAPPLSVHASCDVTAHRFGVQLPPSDVHVFASLIAAQPHHASTVNVEQYLTFLFSHIIGSGFSRSFQCYTLSWCLYKTDHDHPPA
jgi:hypothetical protein